MAFFFSASSLFPPFDEITTRSVKLEKIKERINFPLSIRINRCLPLFLLGDTSFISRQKRLILSNHFPLRGKRNFLYSSNCDDNYKIAMKL